MPPTLPAIPAAVPPAAATVAEAPVVTIADMPDYQKALQRLSVLAQHEQAFVRVVNELGMSGEMEKTKAAMEGMRPQAEALTGKEAAIDARLQAITHESISARNKTGIGTAVIMALAAGGSYLGVRKRDMGKWKKGGIIAGISVVAGIIGQIVSGKIFMGKAQAEAAQLAAEAGAAQQEKQQLAMQGMGMQKAFMEAVATRMLEQQKALAGDGAEMKLVSTAAPTQAHDTAAGHTAPAHHEHHRHHGQQPHPDAHGHHTHHGKHEQHHGHASGAATSPAVAGAMTEKYATPPAESKAAAVEQSREGAEAGVGR